MNREEIKAKLFLKCMESEAALMHEKGYVETIASFTDSVTSLYDHIWPELEERLNSWTAESE